MTDHRELDEPKPPKPGERFQLDRALVIGLAFGLLLLTSVSVLADSSLADPGLLVSPPSRRFGPSTDSVTGRVTQSQARSLTEQLRAEQYAAVPAPNAVVSAHNPAHQIGLCFARDGVTLTNETVAGQVRLKLRGYGFGAAPIHSEPVAPISANGRIEYRRDGLVEWYRNDENGVEQGFTLTRRPDSSEAGGPLRVEVGFETELAAVMASTGQALSFQDQSGRRLFSFGKLSVVDATGRVLPARMEIAVEAKEFPSGMSRSDRDQDVATAPRARVSLLVDEPAAVYPLTIDPLVVNEQAILTLSDGAENEQFGYTVAISGDTAIIGAPYRHEAFIYIRGGAGWVLQTTLNPVDGAAVGFGSPVAISGDTAMVWSGSGERVFVRSGTNWVQQAILPRQNLAASINGDTILVRGTLDQPVNGIYQDAVYVFVRQGTNWTQQTILTAADWVQYDEYGSSTAISGDTAVVAADRHRVGATPNQGQAYVYVRVGEIWVHPRSLYLEWCKDSSLRRKKSSSWKP